MHPVLQVAVDYLLTLDPAERAAALNKMMETTTVREAHWDYLGVELHSADGHVVGILYEDADGREAAIMLVPWGSPAILGQFDTAAMAAEELETALQAHGYTIVDSPFTSEEG